MKQWEIDLRATLEKKLPNGAYEIGNDKFKAWTGKGGYIEYRVELQRTVNEMEVDEPKDFKLTEDYNFLTKDKLNEVINRIFYGHTNNTE